MRTSTCFLILSALCSLDWSTVLADDFTRFRGADATGVAKNHPELSDRWTKTDNVAWVADVPGSGWGSPIVVGNRVFVSSVAADEENTQPKGGLYLGQGVRDPAKGNHHWMVYCFDLSSGKELWRHEAHSGRPSVPRHPKSSYAAETPTTDGERLYVLFGDLGLYCYSLYGEPLWSMPIEPKKTNLDYGAAASPVVHDGQVFVVYDNKEESWIASFDAETGEPRWRTERDETHSWATPFVWRNEKRTEIVVPGQRLNRSYSLDGKELWNFDGNMSVLVIPSPFAAHGMCYISSGYVGDSHRPTFAIRPGATGKLATKGEFEDSEFIEWYQPKASPYNPTQIVYGDYLYTVYDQGFMTCHNALTGEEVYGKRRFSPKGSFTASPWAYNGKVFCLSEDGLTYVIKAGPDFEILNTNPLDELCIATPSVTGGKLLIRTLTKVYCITRRQSTTKADSTDDSAIVQTKLGPVSGTESRDDSIEVFKGIPYAAPPTGELRWQPPQPAAEWSDVRECDQFAAKSLQKNRGDGGAQSEDCLYLNVWTARERAAKKRPVMVWIHGGGFTQGSGHEPGYDGTQLAKRGVVAVTINYRLGALGFMTHPALSAESPHGSSGNYAILDQIAALKWVHDNIANFGGDPDNVTIFGESAGGTSVYLLTATPLSRGLFHRAILQSPWLDPVIFRDLKDENENGPPAEFDGQEQARKLLGDEADSDDVLAKLRAIPADDVLNEIKQRWPVAVDGWIFPKPPHEIYADGDQHDIPVIIGTNRDEGTMFAPRKAFGGTLESYKQAMVERYGEDGDRIAEFYAPESEDELWNVAVQQITDVWFVQPAREFARAMDSQGTDVWRYHFTKPVWGWMGAAHAAEIGYVFGNLEEPKADDAELSDAFMDYWVEFAKSGNPNVKDRTEWPQYTSGEARHLVMDKETSIESGLRRDACDLLDEILLARRQREDRIFSR